MKILLSIFILFLGLSKSSSAEEPTYDKVAKLYVATFNRAPDVAGLEYWVYKSNLSLEGVAKSFFDQPETKALYPSRYSNSDFIDAIYKNVFDREADKAGKNYWLNELNSKQLDRATFILAVINGALGRDAILLENKTEVALEFAWRGLNDIKLAKDIMRYVTSDPKSIKKAIQKIDIYLSNLNSNRDGNNGNSIPSSNDINCKEQEEDDYCLNEEFQIEEIDTTYSNPPKKIGWYLRVIAEAQLGDGRIFIQNRSGVFGEYIDSVDGKDKHDIKSYGTAILKVVFIHKDWKDNTTYFSDYRAYQSDSPRREVWTIQIRNDKEVNLANASLKLSLDGLYEIFDSNGEIQERLSKDSSLKKSIKIIDVDNGKLYLYGDSKSIDLSMDGKHRRTFRIIRGEVTDDDYEAVDSIESRNIFRAKVRGLQKGFGLPPNL